MRRNFVVALLAQSLRSEWAQPKRFILMSSLMFVQDAAFILAWQILFVAMGNIRGWRMEDMCLMFGMIALGVSVGGFTMNGSRRIAHKILSGELDAYIARPRHALPQIVFSESGPSNFGDIVFALCLLIGFSDLNGFEFVWAILLSLLITIIFQSSIVIFQSLAFFAKSGGDLAEPLYEMLIVVATIPQQFQGPVMKVAIFTLLPAGYVTILPMEFLRGGHPAWVGWAISCAAIVYPTLAIIIFNRGLRHYVSASGRFGDA